MTGQGGWPLNAFLTPEQAPFYAGTYFPPEPRHGLPSWRMVLDGGGRRVGASAATRSAAAERADRAGAERHRAAASPSVEPIRDEQLREAVTSLWRVLRPRATAASDGAPKFPPASVIEFLLARGEREMSLGTLRGDGARRDLRPDRRRLCPLRGRRDLDRAPLREDALRQRAAGPRLPARLAGLGRASASARVCCETLDWALREMRGPEGGFCSALDADSEGVEGKFYVWTRRRAARRARTGAGRARDRVLRRHRAGNFEHGPTCSRPAARARRAARRDPPRLLEAARAARAPRARRQAADLVERADDLGAGRGRRGARTRRTTSTPRSPAPTFLLDDVRDDDGRLLRTWKDGAARIDAYLEDHAYLLEALLTLYEATFDPRWYARGGGAGRHDHRALLRSRARRLLHHRRRRTSRCRRGARTSRTPRSRRATRPPRSACCGWRCCRARASTSATRSACCGCCTRSRCAHPHGVRAPAAGGGLLPGAGARGRDRRAGPTRPTRWWPWSASSYRPHLVLAGAAAAPTACRCSRAASRSTAMPRRTSASTSSARRR